MGAWVETSCVRVGCKEAGWLELQRGSIREHGRQEQEEWILRCQSFSCSPTIHMVFLPQDTLDFYIVHGHFG